MHKYVSMKIRHFSQNSFIVNEIHLRDILRMFVKMSIIRMLHYWCHTLANKNEEQKLNIFRFYIYANNHHSLLNFVVNTLYLIMEIPDTKKQPLFYRPFALSCFNLCILRNLLSYKNRYKSNLSYLLSFIHSRIWSTKVWSVKKWVLLLLTQLLICKYCTFFVYLNQKGQYVQ